MNDFTTDCNCDQALQLKQELNQMTFEFGKLTGILSKIEGIAEESRKEALDFIHKNNIVK